MATKEIQDLVAGMNLDRKHPKVYHSVVGISDLIRMLANYWDPKPFTSLPPMYVAPIEREITNLLNEHVLEISITFKHTTLMTSSRWAKFFENLRHDHAKDTEMYNKALIMRISIAFFFNTKFNDKYDFYGTVNPKEPGYAKELKESVPKWMDEGQFPDGPDDFAEVMFFLAEIDDLAVTAAKAKVEQEEIEEESSGDNEFEYGRWSSSGAYST